MLNTEHSLAAQRLKEIFETELTVSHIAEFELDHADPAASTEKVRRLMEDADFDVMPIQGEAPDKYVDLKDMNGEQQAIEVARPIAITDVVAESTSIIQALKLLTKRQWYFVLRGDRVSGIVARADLRKPPVQMFLFGLVLLFESKLVRLIENHYSNGEWEKCLTEKRLADAQDLLRKKKARNDALGLIDCLMLCDKGAIVRKTPELLASLGLSKKEAKELFGRAETLRNALAHGEDYLEGIEWPDVMDLVEKMEASLTVFDGTILLEATSADVV